MGGFEQEPVMYKSLLGLAFFVLSGTMALAQQASMPMNAKDLKWSPAPNIVPPGAQMIVISGDPNKDGLYVIRLKMPAGYKIPAHSHPTSEYVTVLSGRLGLGMGDKLDTKKGATLGPGGFVEAPAKMNHYAWAATPTIVQIHGEGPFAINYVDPADDPSKKQ